MAEDTSTQQINKNVENINREFQEKSVLSKAQELKIPYVNIIKTPLNQDYVKILTIEEIEKSRVIPFFKVNKKLRVAVDDVDSLETKRQIEKLESQGYEIMLNLASSQGIDETIETIKKSQNYQKIEIVEKVNEEKLSSYEKEIKQLKELPRELEGLSSVQALNQLNIAAMKTNASDVHYEPYNDRVEVRFRIDGVLNKVFDLSKEIYKNISNQIKYSSKMQLNVYNIPQDGRYTFSYNEKIIAVRVSSIPTPFGESFVCRFLVSETKPLDFEEMGFMGTSLKKIKAASKISQGMILSTGPTGSGKTTTLYALLSQMNNSENKVITLEDPVEYNIEGVTQSQIDEEQGYDFNSGLRTILRQDPDVVMLGEIRDLETAEVAAQAALTGHVLLTTLHTNSAVETIPRLINMGLPPFMVAPALSTIVAQRLVRKVCPHCSTMENITESEKREFENVMANLSNVNKAAVIDIPSKLPKANGCDKCSNTGYSGRMVLAEVITVNSEIEDLILNNASSIKIIVAARKEGMITMREDGYLKVAQGFTTLDEVYRVTNIAS